MSKKKIDNIEIYYELQKIHQPDKQGENKVVINAVAKLPSRYGMFIIMSLLNKRTNEEFVGILKGNIIGGQNLPFRIHSQCQTSEVFGSLRCDCLLQLEVFLREIEKKGNGFLIYQLKEGRGIGLSNKIKAYQLQDDGYDTIEANEMLGFEDDLRQYEEIIDILRVFQIKSVNLWTNSKDKINQLKCDEIKVHQTPMSVEANEYNKEYLETKKMWNEAIK